MTDTTSEEPGKTIYDELPDAPPKQRMRFSLTGKISIAIVVFWVFIAIFGPLIAPYDEGYFIEEDSQGEYFDDPSFMLPNADVSSWLGTDYIGRDVFSRLVWGARTTIGISFAATALAYLIGVTLGLTAAVAGRLTDMTLSRTVEGVLAFPNLMLGLIVVAAFPSLGTAEKVVLLIILGGIIYAASVFRIARALAMDIMVQDFVEAAKARGEGLWWIITREILPNAVMPLATDFGLRFIYVILFVTALGYLGLGVPPPVSEWGTMVNENRLGIQNGFGGGALASIAPAVAIASLTIAINLIVDDISAQSGGSLAKKMV